MWISVKIFQNISILVKIFMYLGLGQIFRKF